MTLNTPLRVERHPDGWTLRDAYGTILSNDNPAEIACHADEEDLRDLAAAANRQAAAEKIAEALEFWIDEAESAGGDAVPRKFNWIKNCLAAYRATEVPHA